MWKKKKFQNLNSWEPIRTSFVIAILRNCSAYTMYGDKVSTNEVLYFTAVFSLSRSGLEFLIIVFNRPNVNTSLFWCWLFKEKWQNHLFFMTLKQWHLLKWLLNTLWRIHSFDWRPRSSASYFISSLELRINAFSYFYVQIKFYWEIFGFVNNYLVEDAQLFKIWNVFS